MFFNTDKLKFYRNSIGTFKLDELSFENTESFELIKDKSAVAGKIDLTSDISKKSLLEMATVFKYTEQESVKNSIFNTLSSNEVLEEGNTYFSQKITYTQRFSDTKALVTNLRFVHEQIPQYYAIDQFLFPDLFPNLPGANKMAQKSQSEMTFGGIELRYLSKSSKGNLFEIAIGNKFKNDKLASVFQIKNDDVLVLAPDEYANSIRFLSNNLYLNSKYNYKLNKVRILFQAGFQQISNRINIHKQSAKHPFYVVPQIGFDWQINAVNR
ncbi:MAG TPA: hypothetical protein DCQ31_00495, partial [Bacteroidales bacterium]|nr:hypothetical protein [Bacteroidales bacterium]